MIQVRTICPRCGEIDVDPERISLMTHRAATHPAAARSRYTFACPACHGPVDLPAPGETVRRLVLAGVDEQTVWCNLDEMRSGGCFRPPHPEFPPAGPPLGPDDVLTFHELLEQNGWFEQLSAGAV